MALNDIEWQGKHIDVDDWDNDRTGFLVNKATIKWNGTAKGMRTLLPHYLETVPEENTIGWSKRTIESIRLSGSLATDGKEKELVIFCIRSYDETEEERLRRPVNPSYLTDRELRLRALLENYSITEIWTDAMRRDEYNRLLGL